MQVPHTIRRPASKWMHGCGSKKAEFLKFEKLGLFAVKRWRYLIISWRYLIIKGM